MAEPIPAPAASANELVATLIARLQPAPFWDHLGCQLVEATPGRATVELATRPEFGRSSNTGDGGMHGGVVATLIDMTASLSMMSLLAANEGRTTIDLNVHFLTPAKGRLRAEGHVRRRGGRTAVIDVEVTSDDGALVAIGRAVFAILRG